MNRKDPRRFNEHHKTQHKTSDNKAKRESLARPLENRGKHEMYP